MKRNCIATGVAIAFASSVAHAGFVVADGGQKPNVSSQQAAPSVATSVANPTAAAPTKEIVQVQVAAPNDSLSATSANAKVRQVGSPTGSLVPIKGFASDVAVAEAMRQVLPEGWMLLSVPGTNLDRQVSWKGGRNWVSTVEKIVTDAAMVASLDWNKRIVAVENDPFALRVEAEQKEAAARAAQANASSSYPTNSSAIVRPVSDVNPNAMVSISLVPGKWLSESLMEEAAKYGWIVKWEMSHDYRIEAPATFTGIFGGRDSVMEQIILAYRDASHPMKVRFWHGNKVAEIVPMTNGEQ